MVSNYLENGPFQNIIPSVYISSNNKTIFVYFDINDIYNLTVFNEKIISAVPKGFVYTVFIKVRYNYNEFFLAGNQFGFNFLSDDQVENQLFGIVIQRIEDYFDEYKFKSKDIVYIEISFIQKDKKLLSEFSLDKPSHISIQENIEIKNKLTIPISINKDSIGTPLPVNISNGIITNIRVTIKNNQVNFLDVIKAKAKFLRVNHKDNIISFDDKFKFYLLKDKYDYILAVKILEQTSIEKIRYSLDGVIINHVTDTLVNNLVIRKSGEKQVVIKGDKVVSIIQNIKIKSITKPSSKALFVENNNIGVIDKVYNINKTKH